MSFCTSGGVAGNVIGNMANAMLVGAGSSGHAEGTPHAAVADGTITVRDQANQQQNVDTLSRDTEHANGSIDQIFDKEKEQRRLQTVQMIGEIGTQVADIARTQGQLYALEAGKAELKSKHEDEPEPGATQEVRDRYLEKIVATDSYKTAEKEWGTGSAIQQGIQAAVAAVEGAVAGDLKSALAGASAPYLAEVIKVSAPNEASRVMAHAIIAGVIAAAQGNSAASGAAGALTTAMAGNAIKQALFGDTPIEELNETQKQTLVTLGTLAAGLSGGLKGGNTAGAVTGAQAGQNELSNNMAGLALVQQMMALHLLNSAAMAEAGSTNPNDQAAQVLAKKVKSGLNEVCLQNPMCVVMAIISAQQTRSDVEESNPAGLPIADKDPTGGKLENPGHQGESNTTLTTPDQRDQNGSSNTGNDSGAPDTGGNNTGNTGSVPDLPNYMESQGYDPRLPIPEATTASNGLKVESNSKHTPGAQGYRPDAGIEPKNSFGLFESSVSVSGNKARYSMDENGVIHRFFPDNMGTYHWSGSTGDTKNPLALDNKTRAQLRKQEGWKIK